MTTHATVDLTCPNCATAFADDVLMSYTRVGTDTDFRPQVAGMDILAYMIHTCPGCGFSGHEDDFSGTVSEEVSRLIAERLTPLVRDERSDASHRYEYAAWVAQWRAESDRAIADFYLRASWCSRDSYGGVHDDQEPYYRSKAIEHFERALDAGTTGAETCAITYLIGELHRRNGEFDDARTWFDRAVARVSGDAEQAWVADLARKQAELAGRRIATDAEI